MWFQQQRDGSVGLGVLGLWAALVRGRDTRRSTGGDGMMAAGAFRVGYDPGDIPEHATLVLLVKREGDIFVQECELHGRDARVVWAAFTAFQTHEPSPTPEPGKGT